MVVLSPLKLSCRSEGKTASSCAAVSVFGFSISLILSPSVPRWVDVFSAGRGSDVQFKFSIISETTPEVLHLRVQRAHGNGRYPARPSMCLTGSHSQTVTAGTSVFFGLPDDAIHASTARQEDRTTCRQLKCTQSLEAAADHRLKVEGDQSDGRGALLGGYEIQYGVPFSLTSMLEFTWSICPIVFAGPKCYRRRRCSSVTMQEVGTVREPPQPARFHKTGST